MNTNGVDKLSDKLGESLDNFTSNLRSIANLDEIIFRLTIKSMVYFIVTRTRNVQAVTKNQFFETNVLKIINAPLSYGMSSLFIHFYKLVVVSISVLFLPII